MPTVDNPRRLVNLADAAKQLDASTKTLRRRIRAGDLEAVLDGGKIKIPAEAIDAYIDRLRSHASQPTPEPASVVSHDADCTCNDCWTARRGAWTGKKGAA